MLRRPSDLSAAMPAGRSRRGGEHLSWPAELARSRRDRTALLVLMHLASLTARRLLELSAEHRTAWRCLEAVRRGEMVSEADRALAQRLDPPAVGEELANADCRLVAAHDSEYPVGLLDLFDPPAGLFVRGRSLREMDVRVAIVGARNCSVQGRDTAGWLAGDLASAGACVVSGAARGIDAAAHLGALDRSGMTIAVLGCGVDVAYPRRHADLLAGVASRGAVVSEYPPGTRAEPFRFPARNRIVAALSRGVVVVEGAVGSGSMITAEHALDIGRDVFAVPGEVSSALAQVPLMLIRDGATMVRGPDDLLSDLGLRMEAVRTSREGAARLGVDVARHQLTSSEAEVLDALLSPSTPDAVASSVGRPVSEVMAALVGLEVRRMVVRSGGRYQRRLGGND
jgi:DNA processing protein